MLEVNAIDLHYGAAQALRAVSLKAEPGKVTCVLGRNGVGKTSLLRALIGQHPVSSGTIAWEGNDVTALAPDERARRGIAYVPQGREIFPLLTVEENLHTGFASLKRDDRSVPATRSLSGTPISRMPVTERSDRPDCASTSRHNG